MSTNEIALQLAKRLELAGFELSVVNESLYVKPTAKLTDAEKVEIKSVRDELVKVVRGRCLSCRRLRDAKGCCWKCWKRHCETCGRDTGSCFIANCLTCQATFAQTKELVAG